MYLNKVYFGDGLYGVEAASLGYFGKHAAEVSRGRGRAAGRTGEGAVHLRADGQRRARDGPAQRRAAGDARREGDRSRRPTTPPCSEPVVLDDALRRGEAFGQYFKEEVRRFLVQRFGWERVYQGGLKVYTTVDLDMQKAAEAEVARALAEIEKRQGARKTHRRGAAAGGARRDGPAHRRSARDGRRPRFRAELVQSRDAGQAPAGFGVQAVRLCRRARARLLAGHAHRRTSTSRS